MFSHASPAPLLPAPSRTLSQASSPAPVDTDTDIHLKEHQILLLEVRSVARLMENLHIGQVDETSRLDSLKDKLQAVVCGTVDVMYRDTTLNQTNPTLEADIGDRVSNLASQVSALTMVVSRLHVQYSRRRTLQHRYEHI